MKLSTFDASKIIKQFYAKPIVILKHSENTQHAIASNASAENEPEMEQRTELNQSDELSQNAAFSSKVDATAFSSKVDSMALSSKVDFTALSSKVDSTALSIKVDSTALSSKVDSTALSSKVDSTAFSGKLDSTALSSIVDSAAFSSEVDSTALSSKVDSTTLSSKIDSTALSSKVDSTALLTKVDSTALSSKVDSTTLLTKVDSTDLPTKVDSTALPTKVDATDTATKVESIDEATENISIDTTELAQNQVEELGNESAEETMQVVDKLMEDTTAGKVFKKVWAYLESRRYEASEMKMGRALWMEWSVSLRDAEYMCVVQSEKFMVKFRSFDFSCMNVSYHEGPQVVANADEVLQRLYNMQLMVQGVRCFLPELILALENVEWVDRECGAGATFYVNEFKRMLMEESYVLFQKQISIIVASLVRHALRQLFYELDVADQKLPKQMEKFHRKSGKVFQLSTVYGFQEYGAGVHCALNDFYAYYNPEEISTCLRTTRFMAAFCFLVATLKRYRASPGVLAPMLEVKLKAYCAIISRFRLEDEYHFLYLESIEQLEMLLESVQKKLLECKLMQQQQKYSAKAICTICIQPLGSTRKAITLRITCDKCKQMYHKRCLLTRACPNCNE